MGQLPPPPSAWQERASTICWRMSGCANVHASPMACITAVTGVYRVRDHTRGSSSQSSARTPNHATGSGRKRLPQRRAGGQRLLVRPVGRECSLQLNKTRRREDVKRRRAASLWATAPAWLGDALRGHRQPQRCGAWRRGTRAPVARRVLWCGTPGPQPRHAPPATRLHRVQLRFDVLPRCAARERPCCMRVGRGATHQVRGLQPPAVARPHQAAHVAEGEAERERQRALRVHWPSLQVKAAPRLFRILLLQRSNSAGRHRLTRSHHVVAAAARNNEEEPWSTISL